MEYSSQLIASNAVYRCDPSKGPTSLKGQWHLKIEPGYIRFSPTTRIVISATTPDEADYKYVFHLCADHQHEKGNPRPGSTPVDPLTIKANIPRHKSTVDFLEELSEEDTRNLSDEQKAAYVTMRVKGHQLSDALTGNPREMLASGNLETGNQNHKCSEEFQRVMNESAQTPLADAKSLYDYTKTYSPGYNKRRWQIARCVTTAKDYAEECRKKDEEKVAAVLRAQSRAQVEAASAPQQMEEEGKIIEENFERITQNKHVFKVLEESFASLSKISQEKAKEAASIAAKNRKRNSRKPKDSKSL